MRTSLIVFRFIISGLLLILLIATSVWLPIEPVEKIRIVTQSVEFDYLGWTASALWNKFLNTSLGISHYLSVEQQKQILRDHIRIHRQKEDLLNAISEIYANPEVQSPSEQAAELQRNLISAESQLINQSKLTEMVIQDQISAVIDNLGLSIFRYPFPPVLYYVTDLPKNLVVSPREVIRQEASISLQATLNLDEITGIEQGVEDQTNFSALVVSVGGVSTYPTMVIDTDNLYLLVETIAHEWIHNYLFFKPLGIRYSASPQLRTMNETTASIAGREIGQFLIETFYLEQPWKNPVSSKNMEARREILADNETENIPGFDFQKAMYETRKEVDLLLAAGKVEEAEDFMERQKKVFWENGYPIRKLNQAYFAFHGAYAEEPFSAAGEDPVGEDVRTLRMRSVNLKEFIRRMSHMTSYEDLWRFLRTY